MEITKKLESPIGTLYFYGEDFFYVVLKDIPRGKTLIELTDKLIKERDLSEPEKRIVTKGILEKAPRFKAEKVALYFFNPRAKDDRGSILADIETRYKGYGLKGDPFAMMHLNLLDTDFYFAKNYPHMSLFSIGEDMYSLSSHFSVVQSIEGLNIATASCRKTSGYFPQEFWFCGILKDFS